jgi:hypothetical protein
MIVSVAPLTEKVNEVIVIDGKTFLWTLKLLQKFS